MLVITTPGTPWEPAAGSLVRDLVRRQAMRLGVVLAEAAAAVWRRLKAALKKGAAMMLVRAYKEAFGAGGDVCWIASPR